MAQPPIPIEEVEASILRAFRDIDGNTAHEILVNVAEQSADKMRAHLELEHSIPGPSSALDCRRQLWFKANGIDADRPPKEAWILAALRGIIEEVIWTTMLGLADPRLEVTIGETTDFEYGVGTPDGELRKIDAIVEFKRKTGWPYEYIRKNGLLHEAENEYAQVQQYMGARGKKWCLWLAAAADHSFYQNIMRKFQRKPDQEYPFFIIEWIQFDPAYNKKITDSQLRLKNVLIPGEEPPAPEKGGADPEQLEQLNPADGAWPCWTPDRLGGCRWVYRCEEAGGFKAVETKEEK